VSKLQNWYDGMTKGQRIFLWIVSLALSLYGFYIMAEGVSFSVDTWHGEFPSYRVYWGILGILGLPLFTPLVLLIYLKLENTRKSNPIDLKHYLQSEQEIQNGTVDEGLWTKALVNANGNEERRKAEYIKLRAEQLQIKFEEELNRPKALARQKAALCLQKKAYRCYVKSHVYEFCPVCKTFENPRK